MYVSTTKPPFKEVTPMSPKNQSRPQGELSSETAVQMPKMYAVVILNDDYTPIDFVVTVLMKIFHKQAEEANRLTMAVHTQGRAVIDIFTYDVAITKKLFTDQMSKEREFPLAVIVEEAVN